MRVAEADILILPGWSDSAPTIGKAAGKTNPPPRGG